jgi:hypothetical protein
MQRPEITQRPRAGPPAPQQQQQQQQQPTAAAAIVPYAAPGSADECRRCLCLYEEIDRELRDMRARTAVKKRELADLADRLAGFMSAFGVDDLQTRDKRLHLRVKTSSTKAPLPKREVEARILAALGGDADRRDRFMREVYEDGRETRQAVRLARVPPPRARKPRLQ